MARVPADQRRQDFIEAAVRIIAEHGVRGATTRRIAEEADAPLATLHYCFHTKEQLFLAVFQHLAEQTSIDPVGESAPVGLGPAAQDWLQSNVEWTVTHDDYGRAQYDLFLWVMRQTDKNADLAREVFDLFFDRIDKALRAAALPEDDTTLIKPMARVLVGLHDGLVLQWHAHHDRTQLDEDLTCALGMLGAYSASTSRNP